MICVRRKIWSETEQVTRPTGRGSCGGGRAKARKRKTYVGVEGPCRQSACNWCEGIRRWSDRELVCVGPMFPGKNS